MAQWTTTDILNATGGTWICGNPEVSFSGIEIDSRKISHLAFFVAIRGETHDGHRFCVDVIRVGVRGVLVETSRVNELPVSEWQEKGIVCIGVENTIHALGNLSAFHRKRLHVSVAAITGSNGKTSTRSMTTEILCRRFRVHSTSGNFNNHIGLPLTLLDLNETHEWAVLELGMNHCGEIERLSEICQPDIGIITMVGTAHLENFSSQEEICDAKAEIFKWMKPNGIAVLNMDDSRLAALACQLPYQTVFFGLNPEAEIRARQIESSPSGLSFCLDMPNESVNIHLPVMGDFMVTNALAAATVGYILGIPGFEIKAGIENFRPVKGRMNVIETVKGIHLIDDTYNANPASMTAAIQSLHKIKGNGRRILVIGDMLELGKDSPDFHRKIGEEAAITGVSILYATGRFAHDVTEGAANKGMNADRIFIGNKKTICDRLKEDLRKDDWVLIKGSRAMGMEEIAYEMNSWADTSIDTSEKFPL